MFTIEHAFDATVITLIDEGDTALPLLDDISITAFEECIVIEQLAAHSGDLQRITLSIAQLHDLRAALNLPEGSYRLQRLPQG